MEALGVLKDSKSNPGGMFDTWIGANIQPVIAAGLKTVDGLANLAPYFKINDKDKETLAKIAEERKKVQLAFSGSDKSKEALKQYQGEIKNLDKQFEEAYLRNLEAGNLDINKSNALKMLEHLDITLTGLGVKDGLSGIFSQRYNLIPGVGKNLAEFQKENKWIPSESYKELLHNSGLEVDKNGIVVQSASVIDQQRDLEYAMRAEREFTNKQKDLSDWAREYKKDGLEKEINSLEYLADQVGKGNSVGLTSASQMKKLLFPPFGEPLPYSQFNEK